MATYLDIRVDQNSRIDHGAWPNLDSSSHPCQGMYQRSERGASKLTKRTHNRALRCGFGNCNHNPGPKMLLVPLKAPQHRKATHLCAVGLGCLVQETNDVPFSAVLIHVFQNLQSQGPDASGAKDHDILHTITCFPSL